MRSCSAALTIPNGSSIRERSPTIPFPAPPSPHHFISCLLCVCVSIQRPLPTRMLRLFMPRHQREQTYPQASYSQEQPFFALCWLLFSSPAIGP
ncbi:hypothetical protein DdX_14375 [Ditylenchus destructor]|uniref:Uncharacterized protein n=1 Tax=Ditylenchus destructor TaxID=166010 RepID=A0AAD4MWX9_9BILA|nr:hypothetical protein DdX_14375 [Ditylenchus destructor]